MEPKTVSTSRRKYDAEFKKEVIKMIESGRTVPEVAQSLGIGNNLIYYWMKRLKKKDMRVKEETEVLFDDEKAALHKRIRELEMERDILKKALGIFSRLM
jgi:transposase